MRVFLNDEHALDMMNELWSIFETYGCDVEDVLYYCMAKAAGASIADGMSKGKAIALFSKAWDIAKKEVITCK